MKTPDWILEGFDSEEEYNKARPQQARSDSSGSRAKGLKIKKKSGKTFKLKRCPKCKSDEVEVIVGGEEGKGSKGWECKKCKWKGNDIKEDELSENEFMKYLDKKGEEVS